MGGIFNLSVYNENEFNQSQFLTNGEYGEDGELLQGYNVKYGHPYGTEVTPSPTSYSNKYTLYVYDYDSNSYVMLKDGDINAYNEHSTFLNGEAFGIKNVRNINGYKELSFNIPYQIVENNELIDNFRVPYCTEEYRVRLQIRDKIDDYIIKEITDGYSDDGLKFRQVNCWHYAFARLSQSGNQLDFEYIDNAKNILTNVLNGSDWSVGTVETFFEDDNVTEKLRTLKANGNTNRYELIQQIAEIFSGFPKFNTISKTVDLFKDARVDKGIVFKYGKNIKSYSLTSTTKELATKIWVEGGESSSEIIYIDDVNPTGEPYILNFGFFIEKGLMTTTHITAYEDFETNIAIINTNIKNTLAIIGSLQSDLVSKESTLEFKTTQKTSKESTVTALTNQRNVTQDSGERAALQAQIDALNAEISTLNSEISILEGEIATIESDIDLYTDNYISYIESKNTELQTFEDVCGDFIREKLYKNDNYTNATALFKDALEVSQLASYPQYEEKIDILDLSKLTGYEVEEFDEYTKVQIEIDPLGIVSDGQIREIVQILDDPRQNTATISTFITDFEDYMSKSFSSTNDLQISKEMYNRARGLTPTGMVDKDFLQQALDQASFYINQQSNSYIDPVEGFISKNLENPDQLVKLNSGGLAISNDGGLTWELALSFNGLVAEAIKAGAIDTRYIKIYNSLEGDGARFYIDGNGLWAYDELGNLTVSITNNGDATFAGSLSAATGTFAGSLTTNAIIAGTVGAGSLTVGGSSINGEINVKDASDVTKVKINRNGITLADDTEIVGGNGVLSLLHFTNMPDISEVAFGNFVSYGYDEFSTSNRPSFLTGYIPPNFVSQGFRLLLRFMSIYDVATTSYYVPQSNRVYLGSSQSVYVDTDNLELGAGADIIDNTVYTNYTSSWFGTSNINPTAGSTIKSYVANVSSGVSSLFPSNTTFNLKTQSAGSLSWTNKGYIAIDLFIYGYYQ
jgi:hypothetical protein